MLGSYEKTIHDELGILACDVAPTGAGRVSEKGRIIDLITSASAYVVVDDNQLFH